MSKSSTQPAHGAAIAFQPRAPSDLRPLPKINQYPWPAGTTDCWWRVSADYEWVSRVAYIAEQCVATARPRQNSSVSLLDTVLSCICLSLFVHFRHPV